MKQVVFVLFLLPVLSHSQTLSPEVVGSSGDYYSASPGQLSWTLGELSIETYNGSSNQLTQGFHQPENGVVSINQFDDVLQINAYPNPFKTILTIESKSENIRISVYDALGNIVLNDSIIDPGPKQLDFTTLESGIYLLKFSDNSGILATTKVQKF